MCFRWNSCIWIRFCTWLGIHMLYLKWLEFARVVRVSVEIVVEGFEYLQNTGSQLILFKKWLYIWNSNNCNPFKIGLLPWMGDNLIISFEIVVIGLAWVSSDLSSTLLPLAQDIPWSLGIDLIGFRVFLFLENITLCSAYLHSAWTSCTRASDCTFHFE